VSVDLAIPTARELETLSPSDRWNIEDAIGEAQDTLRQSNDDELRRWVEVEGKSFAEVGRMVNRHRSTVAERASRLGVQSSDRRGGDRTSDFVGDPTKADEAEVVDGEIVEATRPTRRKPQSRYADDDGRPGADSRRRSGGVPRPYEHPFEALRIA
jgi:hypothetical protein